MKTFNSNQRGATLLTVLLLLLIMTLIGLATMRGVLLEEKMSSNLYDRNLSFQASEVALRTAEAQLLLPANRVALVALDDAAIVSGNFNCNATGYCPSPGPNLAERWMVDANWFDGPVINGVQTQYIIEYMGESPSWRDCDKVIPQDLGCMTPRYRISARSDTDGRSQVVLQTNFASPAA